VAPNPAQTNSLLYSYSELTSHSETFQPGEIDPRRYTKLSGFGIMSSS
jgi:hypothetical protein